SAYMEVYAAVIDSVDQSLQAIRDFLIQTGEYENTIFVLTSDNGATGEGGLGGTRSYLSRFARRAGPPADWPHDIERDPELIGGPRTFVHYASGWGHACNTPFRLYKGHTFEGGVRVPFLISWPAGLPKPASDTGIRAQYAYVTDVGQTLLELAGLEPLSELKGRPTQAVDGRSFVAVLADPSQRGTRALQYSEMTGHRSLLYGNWKVVTEHQQGAAFDDSEWELYDMADDPTESSNLAGHNRSLISELGRKWEAEAWRNTVFPLDDDGSFSRRRPPSVLEYEAPVRLFPGTPTLERFRSSRLTQLRSFKISIRFNFDRSCSGVLVSHGDQGGGYVVFVQDGQLRVSFNEYGTMLRDAVPLNAGLRDLELCFQVHSEFRWLLEASIAGTPVLTMGPVLQLLGMAPFTGISVGVDRGGPVDWELYEANGSFAYSGVIDWVEFVPGDRASYSREEIARLEEAVERAYE
ncbi:MAG: sulfatase-like hydrolase/transferase, partial [Acidimicrobiales bacterium]